MYASIITIIIDLRIDNVVPGAWRSPGNTCAVDLSAPTSAASTDKIRVLPTTTSLTCTWCFRH